MPIDKFEFLSLFLIEARKRQRRTRSTFAAVFADASIKKSPFE
jgi:hypothetical protein